MKQRRRKFSETVVSWRICPPMHQDLLEQYPDLAAIYDKIQQHNAEHPYLS